MSLSVSSQHATFAPQVEAAAAAAAAAATHAGLVSIEPGDSGSPPGKFVAAKGKAKYRICQRAVCTPPSENHQAALQQQQQRHQQKQQQQMQQTVGGSSKGTPAVATYEG